MKEPPRVSANRQGLAQVVGDMPRLSVRSAVCDGAPGDINPCILSEHDGSKRGSASGGSKRLEASRTTESDASGVAVSVTSAVVIDVANGAGAGVAGVSMIDHAELRNHASALRQSDEVKRVCSSRSVCGFADICHENLAAIGRHGRAVAPVGEACKLSSAEVGEYVSHSGEECELESVDCGNDGRDISASLNLLNQEFEGVEVGRGEDDLSVKTTLNRGG